MIFTSTPLIDAWLIGLEPQTDIRGFYSRAYCEREFYKRGLNTQWTQMNHSYTALAGTLRGMHYQRGGDAEIKLVRCLRGTVYDVIIDLRSSSATRHQWFGVELDAARPLWLYIPKGFAHGFLTLTPDVEMEYLVSAFYAPEAQGGLRYNDPHFKIAWPRKVEVIAPRDLTWPDFDPARGDPLIGGLA
jgi:dTDP-4-dehydrorhamnose 3,5-epimerase